MSGALIKQVRNWDKWGDHVVTLVLGLGGRLSLAQSSLRSVTSILEGGLVSLCNNCIGVMGIYG